MKALAAVAAAAALVAVVPRPARACSLFGYDPMFLSAGSDTVAPTLSVGPATVWRGDGSCAGTGLVQVEVTATDDQTPANVIGYQVLVTRGDVRFPGLPATPFTQLSGDLSLHFNDTGQALDLTLQVRAVDRNGNLSAPVDVDVRDVPPGDEGGCAVGGSGVGAGAGWLAALALVPLVRRRRRARR